MPYTAFYERFPKIAKEETRMIILLDEAESGFPTGELLELLKAILKDRVYVERIKRHYKMFRDKIREEYKNEHTFFNTEEKIGRNSPCPCGSGKKYKKCCE